MPYDPNETPVGYDLTETCLHCSGWGCVLCLDDDAAGAELPIDGPLTSAERREIERNLVAPLFDVKPVLTFARSCGFFCLPASHPDDREPFDCKHDESAHYSIDGEATGCAECEADEAYRMAGKPS